MDKNISVVDKKNKRISFTDQNTASTLIRRKKAKWVAKDTIKLFKTKQEFKKFKNKIIEEENRICYICNIKIPENEIATIDHVTPMKQFGEDSRENLHCCCVRCNGDKKQLSIGEYYLKVMSELDSGKYDYLNINKFKETVETILNKKKNK